jgi:MOSC domain-containing protein YiiM
VLEERVTGQATHGRIDAVCVMHALIPDRNPTGLELTAIDKRPVADPVHVGFLGLDGDDQFDKKHHGGVDQAVYVYATEEAERWSAELGYEVRPGQFGENLRTLGLAVSDVVVGERWQVGEEGVGPLLESRSPRVPCATFQAWFEEPHWVKRFTEQGDTGAYFRVLREGTVLAGDEVTVVHRPGHGVTIRQVFVGRRGGHVPALRRLADEGEDLDPRLIEELQRQIRLATS